MPDEPTPGAVAYLAYHRAYDADLTWMTPWPQLVPMTRACWEAAAQAVRNAYAQTIIDGWQTKGITGAAIVEAINAREAASLEALRRAVEEEPPDA